MEGPLSFICSIGKCFFFPKVGDKQLGLKSLASFTNIGPDAYVYCCGNTVIVLLLAILLTTSIPAVMQSIINKTRERTRRAGAATGLFICMSHLSTTGVLKLTKLLRFCKRNK